MHVEIDRLVRSRRRSLSIEITTDGQLIARAPMYMSMSKIQKFIDRKSGWINEKLAERQNKNSEITKKDFIDGDLFFYLGSYHKLQIVDMQREPLLFDGNIFTLKKSKQQNAENIFVKWYKNQARTVFQDRAKYYAEKYGFNFEKVKLSSADKRFGSCSSKGNLNFVWRLVMAPISVVDYIIVHELCHLKQMNHSKKFWDLVSSILPDYKDQEKWLKQNSHILRVN